MLTNVLSFILGLALFLFGMNEMGKGLTAASGGKLEKILAKLTSTPIRGVCSGAAVTAIIQSSSATTVMVVGFVNSGIMQLRQAVGVIMGANIGTTATSWILSLTGIEGDNLFLELLQTHFVFTGSGRHWCGPDYVLQTGKTPERRFDSGGLCRFDDRHEHDERRGVAAERCAGIYQHAHAVQQPLLWCAGWYAANGDYSVFFGFCGHSAGSVLYGVVTYSTALPIIMGQNIGTCVTALLSAVGASKNARRARLYTCTLT